LKKKKVGGGCELPGADMQKPHASKCGQGKIKIDLFRYFFTKIAYVQVMNFIPIKVSTLHYITSDRNASLYERILTDECACARLGHFSRVYNGISIICDIRRFILQVQQLQKNTRNQVSFK
jgi:hypothetical protein